MDNQPTIPSALSPFDSLPANNAKDQKAHPILAILAVAAALIALAFLFRH
jgi:putative exporter of polyketide antibiotics